MKIRLTHFIALLIVSLFVMACDVEDIQHSYPDDSEEEAVDQEVEDGDGDDEVVSGGLSNGGDENGGEESEDDLVEYTPIYTSEQLAKIGVDDAYPLDGDYILMDNIDLSVAMRSDVISYWTPIGSSTAPFTGAFDGDDYIITGLNIDMDENYQGLFGYIVGASIVNVVLKEPSVVGGYDIGAVVGTAYGSSIIQNCRVEGGYVSGSSAVGGVAGRASEDGYRITIASCYNSSTIYSSGTIGIIGGIAGVADSIIYCCNIGDVSGKGHVGGIAGAANSVTASCNTGSISGSSSAVGGIVGNGYVEISPITITACYNQGDVSGSSSVGGVIGNAYAASGPIYITSCYSSGAISGSSNTGGIAGSTYANATYSGAVEMLSCYYIDQEGDDAQQAVGSDSASEYDYMTLTSVSTLNAVVDVMNSSAEEVYFVEGSPIDSVLPYLAWE